MNYAAILSQYRLGVTAGALVFAFTTLLTSQAPAMDWGLALCMLLAVLSERWLLVLPRYGPFTLSESILFAVVFRYGPVATLLVALLAGLSRFQRESKESRNCTPEFVSYSLSQNWLSYGCAAWAWYSLRGLGQLLAHNPLFDLTLMLMCGFSVFGIPAYLVAVHHWCP